MIKEWIYTFGAVPIDSFIITCILIGIIIGLLVGAAVRKNRSIHKYVVSIFFIGAAVCEIICALGTPGIYGGDGYDVWGGWAYQIELFLLPAAVICLIIFLIGKVRKHK